MNEKIRKALNGQINAELYSSYLYLSMASYFKRLTFDGAARWMQVQAIEELTHAMKFFNFVCERGGKVDLTAIEGPPVSWDSPLSAFEAVYSHEVRVSGMIYDLVNIATKEKDHATVNFLQWFVTEQVEEEAGADSIVQKLKLIGGEGGGLYLLDQELAQRVFTPPPGTTILAGAGKGQQ
ncbi:MAG TPA: ferritin [Syntrophobacteraceae bacterium]|nr:ferritin [Syntrophobacteraceae bacterium]